MLAAAFLLACAPHECERDWDCPDPDGGCAVPALQCVGPMVPACREYHCSAVCACLVGQ